MNLPKMIWIRRLVRRIKNIIRWLPILWEDEDWDQAYLLKIMRFKISCMREEIQRNKRHLGWEKYVRDMKVAEELLSRQAFSDFYLDNRSKEYCTCKEEDFLSCFVEVPGEKYRMFKNPLCDFCSKHSFKQMQDKEKFEHNFVFDHIKRNLRNWWD